MTQLAVAVFFSSLALSSSLVFSAKGTPKAEARTVQEACLDMRNGKEIVGVDVSDKEIQDICAKEGILLTKLKHYGK